MRSDIPLFPLEVILRRRPLGPCSVSLRGLMLLVAALAIATALGLASYRRWPAVPVHATSTDPKIAARQEKVVIGVRWGMSYEEAAERAASEGRPLLIYFASTADANGRLMEREVLPHAEVARLLSRFEVVQLHEDRVPIGSISAGQREVLASANIERHLKLAPSPITPSFIAMSPRGTVLSRVEGYQQPRAFADFLNRALRMSSR